ncbi:MAG: sensor histidine kinase, partial [Calditrichota bacterium]
DPEALELAVRNLVDNAVKYSKPPAEVDILVTHVNLKKIHIEILDRGVGIPKSKRSKVFKRFYRIQPAGLESASGAGIGLSLAREIVRAHKGRIWLEDREGGGSAFKLELPVGKGI